MSLQLVDDRPPIPPADLILRVAPRFGEADIEANRASFDLGAVEHLQCFERALAGQGRAFADFERLLDFGCGCGRFLRHLGFLAGEVELHGTDIDPEMVAWVSSNIPYVQASVAPHEPPLPYPDAHFDLIINHSVFSHLDERYQDLWLAELRRIARPGGLVLLTVEGQSGWGRLTETAARNHVDIEAWRRELEAKGIVFVRDDFFVGSTHPDFYHSTFHASWYVFEHWSRFFDIAAYLPDGSISQDLIVLRRRAGESPPAAVPPPRRARQQGAPTAASLVRRAVRRARQELEQRRPGRADQLARELSILRAGLYEQGNRISVIASELRAELDALRRENASARDD